MKNFLIIVRSLIKIEFLKCPLFIWILLAFYEILMLSLVLIQAPPWLYISSDMQGYIERAQWLARGIYNEIYTVFYPQGTHYLFYPFFKFFDYFTALHLIAIFQTWCIIAAIYFLYRFVLDLFNSRLIAGLSVVGLLIFRTPFSLSSFYLSENVFYLFMIFSLWMIYRIFVLEKKFNTATLILIAFISGYTVLIRPVILYGYFIIGLFILIKQRKHFFRKQVLLFIFIGMLPTLLQSIYTSSLLKRPSLFTAGGGYETFFALSGYRAITSETHYGTWTFVNNTYKIDPTIVEEVRFPYALWDNKEWMNEVKKLWKEDTKRVMKNIFRNCTQVWWTPVKVWPMIWRGTSPMAEWFIPLTVYVWIIYPLALLGIYIAFRRKWHYQLVMLIGPVIGLQLMCFTRCGEPRNLIPFFWLIIVLASTGIYAITSYFNKKPFLLKNDEIESYSINMLVKVQSCLLILLCFFMPIVLWKIKTADPAPTWFNNADQLQKLKYTTLTSMKPISVYAPWSIIKNKRIFGGPIEVNNIVYKNGLFTAGNTEITYNLNGKYDYFETDMAIEQHADFGGRVIFQVLLDSMIVYPNPGNQNIEKYIIRCSEEPKHLKLSVKGAKKIKLETISAFKDRWYDRGVWIGPVVWKE